ncbi:MAG: PAS domain-containing protein [Acidimicrobiales bacterium]
MSSFPSNDSGTLRWIEIAETSHDGLAVLDANGRFDFVSERFGELLGVETEQLLGSRVVDIVPGLSSAWSAAERGSPNAPLRHEHQVSDPQRGTVFSRLTFIRRHDEDGALLRTIALSQDLTSIRVAQHKRRAAQRRLTAVGQEERTRACDDLHDGPIQILTALLLRLGRAGGGIPQEQLEELRALEETVRRAATELRSLLLELMPEENTSPAELFEEWIAPLISDSNLSVEVTDHATVPARRPLAEALFVFLYEVMQDVVSSSVERTARATITDRDAGYELLVLTPEIDPHNRSVERRALITAADHYARWLGGTLDVRLGPDRVSRVKVWLPDTDLPYELTFRGDATEAPPSSRSNHSLELLHLLDVELTNADWKAVAAASHEGLMDLDRDLNVTFVNDAYAGAMRRSAHELVGLPFSDLFHPDDFRRLLPQIRRVMAGESVRFHWRRRNAAGEPRWTQVAGTPRLDIEGAFDGALMVTLDTTDLHIIEDLIEDVVADVEIARRAAQTPILARVEEGPIEALRDVRRRLREGTWEGEITNNDVENIVAGLERTIVTLRRSLGNIREAEPTTMTWEATVHGALQTLADTSECRFTIRDRTTTPLAPSLAGALMKIAQEATANAVFHGPANNVTIELVELRDEFELDVRDDGAGISEDDLLPRSGHLGIKSMMERAASLGGRLEIRRGDERGTVVRARVPKTDGDIRLG